MPLDVIKAIARDIKQSRHIVAFTGAGISAESGISTYRGENGLWKKYDPRLYASIDNFNQNPSYYWNFFKDIRYPSVKKAVPNPGHLALAELEKSGRSITVITQNIDELHQEAGSSSVVELHGTTRVIFCMSCSIEYSMDDVFSQLKSEIPPLCSKCRGHLRPNVVFFGESLNPQTLNSAYKEADNCDFLLAVGSSLVVYPAADIPLRVKLKGGFLAIINKEPTPMDHLADHLIHDEAGRILPLIIQYVMSG